MVEHILVPTDGSTLAGKALEYAVTHHPNAAITLLYVIDPVEGAYMFAPETAIGGEQWYDQERDRAESVCERAVERAAEYDVAVTAEIEVGRPARVIVEFADAHDIDHIIIGSHGREGLSRLVLGSVAEAVMRRSPVPVTVIR